MELADYNITFVHIKANNNILADAISRFKTPYIYIGSTYNMLQRSMHGQHTSWIVRYSVLSKNGTLPVKKETLQSCCGNRSVSTTVVISVNSILQKQQYIHGLKQDVTRAPHSIRSFIMHEFYNYKVHYRTICMLKTIKRSYCWTKLC